MDRDELIRILSQEKEERVLQPCRSFSDLFGVLFLKTVPESTDLSRFQDLRYQLSGFNHYKLLREGHKKLIARLGKAYPDCNKADIKKISSSALLVSRYFHRFHQFSELEAEYKNNAKDDETLITFLDDFRKTSRIFGMYFMKASQVVMESQIVDIPALDGEIKKFLMTNLLLPDDNKVIYKEELRLKRRTGLTGLALCDRLRKLVHDRNTESH